MHLITFGYNHEGAWLADPDKYKTASPLQYMHGWWGCDNKKNVYT